MTGDPRIFISYSRQDGARAAAEIRDRLAREGLSLWQDLVAMEGGRDWWRQIEEAIAKAEYLVLLLTPKALESEVCAKEWRYARQQGTYVVPVSDGPPGALELHRLAGWMRRADIVDFRVPERWTWLVGRLKQPPQIRRVPMMAEAPPSDFVPRPAEFARLKAALLDPARKDAVGITAALKGAGGYGKTTLARALCADEAIQDAYHDGVLWVTLGESPGDLLGRVEDLIATVSGARPAFANVEAACVRLEELLAERRMLVVIDDAWNAADTRPFLRGGPHCARLLTTRDSGTLPRGAAEQPVDQMRDAEAVALLRAGLPDGETETFSKLAARLGEWPLLLRLVNGALVDRVERSRAPLPEALAHVGRLLDKRGLTAFDAKDPRERRDAVGKTLALSLDRLDLAEQARLCELAVFPEDAQVPLGTVGLLWQETAGLDDIDTDELLQRLHGLSLLLQLDLDRRFLQLHDVIRAWLRDRLGDGLAAVERALVSAYRSACDGEWHRLDDAYALAHLPMHLRSVDAAAWRRLLLDPRWMARKLVAPGVAALINDYSDTEGDLRLVGDALRLSAHVIGRDPSQLASQLCGRLGRSQDKTHRSLIAMSREAISGPTLLPSTPSLTPPGGMLVMTHATHLASRLLPLPDCRRCLSSSESSLRLWDMSSGNTIATTKFDADRCAVSQCGTFVLGINKTQSILWNTVTNTTKSLPYIRLQSANPIALFSNGTAIVVYYRRGSKNGPVILLDLNSGQILCTYGHTVNLIVSWSEEHNLAMIYNGGTHIELRSLENGNLLSTYEFNSSYAEFIKFSVRSKTVLIGYQDDCIATWKIEDESEPTILTKLKYGYDKISLSQCGRFAALAPKFRGEVEVWDLEKRRILTRLKAHSDTITMLELSDDGSGLVTRSDDGTMRLWTLPTDVRSNSFEMNSGRINALIVPSGSNPTFGTLAWRQR